MFEHATSAPAEQLVVCLLERCGVVGVVATQLAAALDATEAIAAAAASSSVGGAGESSRSVVAVAGSGSHGSQEPSAYVAIACCDMGFAWWVGCDRAACGPFARVSLACLAAC